MVAVLAPAAIILVAFLVGLVLIWRSYRRDRRMAKEAIHRPVYPVCDQTIHAVKEWEMACEKSLAWSRERRNKEA